jgi:uncharacterized repeat protein (TIGR01451 family)
MVVTATHTTDWQWQAVNDRMEMLRRQGYIHKQKQDPAGSTHWTMTPKGQNYLGALERAEEAGEDESPIAASSTSASKILPPSIAKSFGATRIGLNQTTSLTFTVSNPNPEAALTGVGFTDTLPTGLVVSSPNGLMGEYGGGNITALDGSANISLSGASLAPGASWQFTVNVTGTSPGGMINTTGPVFSSEGGTGNTASAPIGVMETTVAPTVPSPMSSPDWLSQAGIERFSDRLRSVLDRADQIRSMRKRPAVSTLHLLMAFSEQPNGQLVSLLKQAGADINAFIPPTDIAEEEPPEDVLSPGSWKFPRITKDVRNALVRARDKSDYTDSTVIDDSHLLFGVLSGNQSDNLVIRELNKKGITADKVKLPRIYEVGPSTHVARDRWTIHDSLGYFPYAYAIYRFLTDKNTASPLAISIQAPWGGGKTSMMRMIQAQLDPDSLQKFDIGASISEKATVKDVQAELKRLSEGKATPIESGAATDFRVPPIEGDGEHRVTVWFNAWKYESTAQVWAGLADSIVHQIADRLGPVDRELFWLRLRLRRVDVAKIRSKIHDQVLGRFWEKLPGMLWAYVVGPVISISVTIAGRFFQHKGWESLGWIGTLLTSGLAALIASKQWAITVSEVEGQPARLSLGELVEAPDYEANLGFVHHVVNDLRRVFELIPKKHRPIVIFIDDLDRCSPNKVSDVIEAVNLFLAGEFPDCMFVLGIDDEMVAAALDKAHSDVISKLPSYAKSVSIGWRFMDKFVQLPFIVPPPTPDDLKKYAGSLFSEGDARIAEIAIETRNKIAQVIEKSDTNAKPQQIAEEVAKEQSLSPQQQKVLEEEAVVIQQMDSNIRAFSDEGKKIRNLLTTIAADFSANPRDIKRFVNVFRFYYFLRAAREARGELVPSLKQLSRWILFSLKWPEGVRFLWRTQLTSQETRHPQLEALEKVGKGCSDIEDWKMGAAGVMGIKPEEKAWILSEEVMRFFKNESKLPEEERLSASCGKGLW